MAEPETTSFTIVRRDGEAFEVLIDASDAPLISGYRWLVAVNRYASRNVYYAHARHAGGFVILHRLILNCPPQMQVDHINGNGLDNRRSNLRLATAAQNTRNRGPLGKNYKGINFDRQRNKWRAKIIVDGKRTMIGRFKTAVEAALAYDQAAIRLHGEFAWLNFPDATRPQNNNPVITR